MSNFNFKNWQCKCGYTWSSECPICPLCKEIGWERQSKDVLDNMEIISIDEALEEIEGKDDDENKWGY